MQALFSFRLLTTTQLFQRGQIFQVSSKKLLSLFFHLSYFKTLAHFLRGHFLIFRYLALTRPALLYCTTSKICWANNRELRSMKLSYIQLPHQANKQIFFVAAAAIHKETLRYRNIHSLSLFFSNTLISMPRYTPTCPLPLSWMMWYYTYTYTHLHHTSNSAFKP